MGIYYNPPQPTQLGPHAGPVTPGDAPPIRSVATLAAAAGLFLAFTNACWAQQGEPRLERPNNIQVKIVPVTLVYGDQPIPVSEALWYALIGSAWPAAQEPRLGYPNQPQQVKVAPLTLVYGQQVPRAMALPPAAAMVPATWGAQSYAPNAGWNVPAVIITAAQPYNKPQTHIWTAWSQSAMASPLGLRPYVTVSGSAPATAHATWLVIARRRARR